MSTTTKTLAGQSVRYRCTRVDKVPCRGASPSITLSVADTVLLDPNDQLLTMYGFEVFSESANANQWNVCGAAVGGYSWDDSYISTQNVTNNTVLTHTYIPNKFNQEYIFFTNAGNNGSAKSHMVIDIQQKCK
jgi:hypothetical protein